MVCRFFGWGLALGLQLANLSRQKVSCEHLDTTPNPHPIPIMSTFRLMVRVLVVLLPR